MKFIATTCYSHVLYMMMKGEDFQYAIHKLEFTQPRFDYEGVAGYIETEVTIEIKDLTKFALLWDAWHMESSTYRLEIYGLAKGRGCR